MSLVTKIDQIYTLLSLIAILQLGGSKRRSQPVTKPSKDVVMQEGLSCQDFFIACVATMYLLIWADSVVKL
jgi:hypothetical protein